MIMQEETTAMSEWKINSESSWIRWNNSNQACVRLVSLKGEIKKFGEDGENAGLEEMQ